LLEFFGTELHLPLLQGVLFLALLFLLLPDVSTSEQVAADLKRRVRIVPTIAIGYAGGRSIGDDGGRSTDCREQ
jgi:hypothetical protein